MKIQCIIGFCIALSFILNVASGQDFVNLDFESATIPQSQPPGAVNTSDALPGWTAIYGLAAQTQIAFNATISGIPQITLLGTNGIGATSIDGGYSVQLQGAVVQFPGGHNASVNASITQTGLVPTTSQAILFEAQPGTETLLVSIGGQNVPFIALSVEPNYTLYGGDVSAFANQTMTLDFTVVPTSLTDQTGWNLDSIMFSSQPIPEPNALGLYGIGVLIIIWRKCGRIKW
jgi:hypothetical protein